MPISTGGKDQAELIQLAIAGIDAQIRELQEKRAQLSGMVSGRAASAAAVAAPAAPAPAGRKRVFSDATREKLSRAAKRRWKRERAEKKQATKASKSSKATKSAKAGRAAKGAKAAKAEKPATE